MTFIQILKCIFCFSGWISDVEGNYDTSFYCSGIFYALSGLVMLFIYLPIFKNTRRAGKSLHESTDQETV